MDDERKLFDKLMEATEGAMASLQREVTQASARAQQAARAQLQLATSEDVARLQATLDRIEAGLSEANRRLASLEAAQGGTGTAPGPGASF